MPDDILKGVSELLNAESQEEEVVNEDIEQDQIESEELESEEKEEVETEEKDDDKEGVEIDEDIYQAALDRGMTEEQILKANDEYPELLEALRPPKQETLSADEEIEVKDKLDPMSEIELKEEDLKALKKVGLDETITSVVDALNKQIEAVNAREKAETENKVKAEKEKFNQQVLTANRKMDEWSKKFPELGTVASMQKTENGRIDYSSSQFKKREQVFNIAQSFLVNGMAKDFDDALTNAYQWLVGSNPDAVKREIVDDINSRKKHFIARPSNKRMKKAQKSDHEDSFMDSIGEFVSKNID